MTVSSNKSPSQRAFSHYLRTGRRLPKDIFIEAQDIELKFNPYHDPRNGQFTFAPGGPRTGTGTGTGTGSRPAPGQGRPHPPAKPGPYTVRSGDTLSHIARRHGVRTDTLARANNIKNPDHIQAGQRLHIPKDAPQPARAEANAPGKGIAGVGKTPPSPIRTGQTPTPPRQPSLDTAAAAGKKWTAKDASVKVPSSIRGKVDQVAEDYHAATGRTLTVTDGARTPQDQAERIYYKFSHGDFRTYKGPQAAQIADAYRQGKAKGKSRSQILSDMSAIIDRHNRNGKPVSKHLERRGVDFRTRDMTAAQQAALEYAIKKHGGKPLKEGVPFHIHASF